VQQAWGGSFYPQAFRDGDFSALLSPAIVNGKPVRAPIIIYDPTNGMPFTDASGKITNIIPPSRINKNAQNIINQFVPLPQFNPVDILDVNTIKSFPEYPVSEPVFCAPRPDLQFERPHLRAVRVADWPV